MPPSTWSAPPRRIAVRANEAHVWLLEIPGLAALRERIPQLLDAEERSRLERFRFAADRDRFGKCRAAMRIVLAQYLDRRPRELRFGSGAWGKPHLIEAGGLAFNLAHSSDVALLAVASGRAVGVDVEKVDAARSGEDVARRFFAPDEVARLDALPPAARAAAFFSCWTRKEAYIKARGDGLALPLGSFSVSFGQAAAPALERSDLGRDEVARWMLFDLPPIERYASALAVEAPAVRPSFWRLPSDLFVGF